MSEVKFLDHGRTTNSEGTPPVWLRQSQNESVGIKDDQIPS